MLHCLRPNVLKLLFNIFMYFLWVVFCLFVLLVTAKSVNLFPVIPSLLEAEVPN